MGNKLLMLVLGFSIFGGMLIYNGPKADVMNSEEQLGKQAAEMLERGVPSSAAGASASLVTLA